MARSTSDSQVGLFSSQDVERLVREKEKELELLRELLERRNRLLERLAELDSRISGLRGEPAVIAKPAAPAQPVKRKRGRPKASGAGIPRGARPSIEELAIEYLQSAGGTARLKDIAEYVAKGRWNASTPTMAHLTMTSSALSKASGIQRISKGMYGLAAGAAKQGRRGRKPGRPPAVGKVGLADQAYDYLTSHGGIASMSDILIAVLGTDQGLKANGLRMAIGRDKRFKRDKEGHVVLAK